MFSRRLSPLSKKSLIAGQPVIFPVYNKHGQLLIDKGAIVTEQNLQTLENVEEIFTLVKEF